MLATVRPRDIAGKTRRRIAAEELAELIAVEAKINKATAELKAMVLARESRLMDIHADVGDVARFADRNRFASWTGTAPLDASSGEQNRHRLSRAGNRRVNHMIHIAAVTQLRLDTEGRAYYRSKRAAGKKPKEALRCLKRRISEPSTDSLSPTPNVQRRIREGTAGRLKNPARSTCPRISTLRISHFPDPRNRRYNREPEPGRASRGQRSPPPVDNRGEPV
jgi:transposase